MNHEPHLIRWGVIGLGRLVTTQIAPVIVAAKHSRLVGCAGSTPEKTRAFADQFKVARCYATMDELAADPDIDAVFIATPNAMHHANVLTAAKARKHILCEKPLALSVKDAEEMVAACRDAGVILRAAFQIRLEVALERVREILRAGTLGELRSFEFERAGTFGARNAWRNEAAQGGALFDIAVHLLDQAEWLTGFRFTEISAYSHPDRRENKADDTVAILGMLGTQCHAVIRASREIPHAQNNLRIQGTKGMLVTSALRWSDEYRLQITTDSGTVEERIKPTAIYRREIEAFEDEVRGQPGILASGEDGVRIVAITTAIIESINTRRSVTVPN